MLAKLKSIGPGLLYPGAAVGVSHLVQSTRAGAKYGLIMILVVAGRSGMFSPMAAVLIINPLLRDAITDR